MTPWIALITGLSTGGLTCMAVQGGLLLGLLAKRSDDADSAQSTSGTTGRWSRLVLPVGAFLAAKILAYTLLGLALGLIGAKLKLSSGVSVWLQSIAGVFIVVTGIRLIFPRWLPWLTITPPAGIRRFIRRQGKNESWLAPAFLGLLTILIPCGITIAMETAAIAAGSAVKAAMILFAFTLGTAPLFLLVGVLAKGATFFQRKLVWATAAIVIGLGIYTFNGAMVMIDSPYTIQNEVAAFQAAFAGGTDAEAAAATNVTINVLPNGYDPNSVTVPAGQPVTLSLAAKGRLGCTSVFRIPRLNVEEQLAPNSVTPVAVTFPSAGRYTFSCGMGMYTGTIEAV